MHMLSIKRPISSLDLLDKIREVEGQAELSHEELIWEVTYVLGTHRASQFATTYLNADNEEKLCYLLPVRDARLVLLARLVKEQAALYDLAFNTQS